MREEGGKVLLSCELLHILSLPFSHLLGSIHGEGVDSEIICEFVHVFIQHTFIVWILCGRHCAKRRRQKDEKGPFCSQEGTVSGEDGRFVRN